MNRRERRAKKQRKSGTKVVGAFPRPAPIGASGALASADPDSLQLQAIQAAQAGDPGRAVELFRKALTLNPHLPEAHFNLALAYAALGRIDEAISQYRKAIELRPGFAEAHNNLGLILREQGKLEEAVKSFARATALRPNYFGAHNNLGLALKGLHRLDAAVASYRRAIAIRPEPKTIWAAHSRNAARSMQRSSTTRKRSRSNPATPRLIETWASPSGGKENSIKPPPSSRKPSRSIRNS
jgi:tetratricopeptide (TPR) repeat protein